jgi:Ca2+-binding EF-hand superfamily protein
MILRPVEDIVMNRFFLAAALASTGFATIALVGPTAAQTTPAPKGDADGDGVVTRDEAMAQADARFDRMDANKDGKLTADEMRPRRPMGDPSATPPAPPPADGAAPPAGSTGPAGRGERMFARLDTNGDGAIDREEFRAQAAQRFDRVDTNKDGKIDAAERQAARDAMGQMRARRGNGGDMPPPPPPAPADKPGQ